MTGSMIERSPRTTSTSAGSGSRYAGLAVRGLIVIGFAGVAWLMSSSAAHASDGPTRAPEGAPAWSLFGTPGSDEGTAFLAGGDPVSGFVRTLAGHHYQPMQPTDVRPAMMSPEAASLTGTSLTSLTGTGLDGVDLDGRTGTHGTGPDGRAGGIDLLSRIVTVSSTIPVQDLAVRRGSGTATAVSHLLTGTRRPSRATIGHRTTGTGAHLGGSTVTAPATRTWKADRAAALFAPSGGPATTVVAAGARGASEKVLPGKDGAVTRHTAARHIAGGGTTSSGSAESFGSQRTRHVPLLPRPAPDPAIPGAGLTSGVPGTGSGPSQDDGAPAIAPATTAASAMAGHRPETADDIEVRTLIAESPTVSPD